ncbi:MAG TPA: HIT family protein [Candidatus Scybalocola faecipullorum]|nr:HIT family protein [Candidatus Scybalocola faecipullorum]
MNDCIFCKIAQGDIPSSTIYEDDDFRVILDLGPATKGHALILPKKHFRNIFEMDDDIAAKIFVLAKKIACAMKKTLDCDGLNIVQNNESIAGQSVFHFHMHIIPRYENDGQHILWKPGSATPQQLAELAHEIANAIK